MEGYQTVSAVAESTFTEKRSRFLSAAAPVSSPAEAEAFLQARRAHYYDAGHTVYAWLLRDGRQKYSDDGEPKGTGGLPVLEVIRRSGLSDVLVAVTRYFGGVLLGAGGLTRAYARGAADAVAAAARVCYEPCAVVEVVCDYSRFGAVEHLYPRLNARLLESAFAADVTLRLLLRAGDAPGFIAAVTELTAAHALAEQVETRLAVFGDFPAQTAVRGES